MKCNKTLNDLWALETDALNFLEILFFIFNTKCIYFSYIPFEKLKYPNVMSLSFQKLKYIQMSCLCQFSCFNQCSLFAYYNITYFLCAVGFLTALWSWLFGSYACQKVCKTLITVYNK